VRLHRLIRLMCDRANALSRPDLPLRKRKRPPKPPLTALRASRVDTFKPVFSEATHGSIGRPTEARGMVGHEPPKAIRGTGCYFGSG
jgi:hypothetical protein